jgi:hypothetical protein
MPITNDYIRNVTRWGFSGCLVLGYQLIVVRSRLISFGDINHLCHKFAFRLPMATFAMLHNLILEYVSRPYSIWGQ